jgi:hypothetical protein
VIAALPLSPQGMRFFLVTNSHVGYGTFLLKHVFGSDWKSLFELSVFNGKKPAFFRRRAHQPFYLFGMMSCCHAPLVLVALLTEDTYAREGAAPPPHPTPTSLVYRH